MENEPGKMEQSQSPGNGPLVRLRGIGPNELLGQRTGRCQKLAEIGESQLAGGSIPFNKSTHIHPAGRRTLWGAVCGGREALAKRANKPCGQKSACRSGL